MSLGEELIAGLEDLNDALRKGEVLKRFRVSKVMKNDDGTVKTVTNDPKTGISVTVRQLHGQEGQ